MFTATTVGQEVGYARSTAYGYQCTGIANVVKVNGHGHVTLSNGMVFDKYGRERKMPYGGSHLVDANTLRTYLAEREAQREQTVRCRRLQDKVRELVSYNARANVTPEIKEELMALVAAL